MNKLAIIGTAFVGSFSAASAAEFFVARDTTSNKCVVVEQKPSTPGMMIVGDGRAYMTRPEADVALKAASACGTMGATATTGTTPAMARVLTTAPADAMTLNHWYKQNVYDPSGAKIGDIEDILVGKDGTVSAFVLGVGGFLGLGEKNVLVAFDAIHTSMPDSKPRLTLNSTKDALKAAPGVKFDRSKMHWSGI